MHKYECWTIAIQNLYFNIQEGFKLYTELKYGIIVSLQEHIDSLIFLINIICSLNLLEQCTAA